MFALGLTSAQSNMSGDELRREIEHESQRRGGLIPAGLAWQALDEKEDQSPVFELLEELAESLESHAREALESYKEQFAAIEFGPDRLADDYGHILPDQFAYYEESCLEWLRDNVDSTITDAEGKQITLALADGFIPLEIRPGTGTVWPHPGAIMELQGPCEAVAPVESCQLSEDTADKAQQAIEACGDVKRVAGESDDQQERARADCADRLDLMPGINHGLDADWAVFVDAPDSLAVIVDPARVREYMKDAGVRAPSEL